METRMPAEEFISKLPVYEVKRSLDFPAFLIVMCGRDDCPGTMADRPFLVSEREWLRPLRYKTVKNGVAKMVTITGRSCPYCFKAGRLPKRRDIR